MGVNLFLAKAKAYEEGIVLLLHPSGIQTRLCACHHSEGNYLLFQHIF